MPTYEQIGRRFVNRPGVFRRVMNLWPPLLFSSIRIDHISADWRHVRVTLKRNPLTANYRGTLYGGSLYSMTDPFWMMMVSHCLPGDWSVWDTAGEIEYVSQGRTHVSTEFRLTDEHLAELVAQASEDGRGLVWFTNEITAPDGTVVARVRKQVHARRRTGR